MRILEGAGQSRLAAALNVPRCGAREAAATGRYARRGGAGGGAWSSTAALPNVGERCRAAVPARGGDGRGRSSRRRRTRRSAWGRAGAKPIVLAHCPKRFDRPDRAPREDRRLSGRLPRDWPAAVFLLLALERVQMRFVQRVIEPVARELQRRQAVRFVRRVTAEISGARQRLCEPRHERFAARRMLGEDECVVDLSASYSGVRSSPSRQDPVARSSQGCWTSNAWR